MAVNTERPSWQSTVESIHRSIDETDAIETRLLRTVQSFLGCPYGTSPDPESSLVDLAAFDCVTLIEAALALARSRSTDEFLTELRFTRYAAGRMSWSSRLHYFWDWMVHNEKRGALKVRTPGAGSHTIDATLGSLRDLPPRQVRFDVVSKSQLRLALPRISDGAIVAFASVRARLDFFHTGILFHGSSTEKTLENLTLYQAQRSAGKVIAEPLVDFLKRNRMRGIAFATPLAKGDRP